MANVALPLAQFGLQAITSLFEGAEERAQEATSENEALGQVIAATYSSMGQLSNAFSSGEINQQSALADLQAIKNAFWQTITPRIQPNRNGCASGSACPSTNGTIPAGYCSKNIGASCCLGCWTIEKMFVDAATAINNGSGTVSVVALAADPKYNFPAFEAQTFVFSEPPSPLDVAGGVATSVSQLLGLPTGAATTTQAAGTSLTMYLIFGAIALIVIVLLLRR